MKNLSCKSPYLERRVCFVFNHTNDTLAHRAHSFFWLPVPSAQPFNFLTRWLSRCLKHLLRKAPKPLSAEQKLLVNKLLKVSQQQRICKSRIDLKVENETLEQVAADIKKSFPDQDLSIQVRGATPVRVSFDLKDTPVGDVLGNVAALAGCKLWLTGSGFLIAPSTQLTDVEQQDVKQSQAGEWGQSVAAGGMGWNVNNVLSPLFAKAVAQEITGTDVLPFPATTVKTTFGAVSPETQALLQQLVSGAIEDMRRSDPRVSPLLLSPNSPISVNTSDPKWVKISFAGVDSDKSGGVANIRIQP